MNVSESKIFFNVFFFNIQVKQTIPGLYEWPSENYVVLGGVICLGLHWREFL